MFRTLLNHATLAFSFEPDGPLLVRSGKSGHDPMRPDICAIRTLHSRGETVYVPGASMKGVLRAHAERILLAAGRKVCDVFDRNSRCRTHDNGASPSEVFRASCPACRTFGSTSVAGRARLGDAYPSDDTWGQANQTEVRNGVGIDRRTQSTSGNMLFDMEVVTRGRFDAELDLQNFELWQLALVLQALFDLDDGLIQLGGMKSRGVGTVHLTDLQLTFSDRLGGAALHGAGSLSTDAAEWGLEQEPELRLDAAERDRGWLRPRFCVRGKEQVAKMLEQLAADVWPSFCGGSAR